MALTAVRVTLKYAGNGQIVRAYFFVLDARFGLFKLYTSAVASLEIVRLGSKTFRLLTFASSKLKGV